MSPSTEWGRRKRQDVTIALTTMVYRPCSRSNLARGWRGVAVSSNEEEGEEETVVVEGLRVDKRCARLEAAVITLKRATARGMTGNAGVSSSKKSADVSAPSADASLVDCSSEPFGVSSCSSFWLVNVSIFSPSSSSLMIASVFSASFSEEEELGSGL